VISSIIEPSLLDWLPFGLPSFLPSAFLLARASLVLEEMSSRSNSEAREKAKVRTFEFISFLSTWLFLTMWTSTSFEIHIENISETSSMDLPRRDISATISLSPASSFFITYTSFLCFHDFFPETVSSINCAAPSPFSET